MRINLAARWQHAEVQGTCSRRYKGEYERNKGWDNPLTSEITAVQFRTGVAGSASVGPWFCGSNVPVSHTERKTIKYELTCHVGRRSCPRVPPIVYWRGV